MVNTTQNRVFSEIHFAEFGANFYNFTEILVHYFCWQKRNNKLK